MDHYEPAVPRFFMLRPGTKTFSRITKRGTVVRVVREQYVRDDIPCGIDACGKCLTGARKLLGHPNNQNKVFPIEHFVVVDTNVFLHQSEIVEMLDNVIVMQTVFEETRKNNGRIHLRIGQLVEDENRHFYMFSNEHNRSTQVSMEENETVNDRNDRAIRVGVKWYQEHFPTRPVLVSNDVDNIDKAREMGLLSCTLRQYVEGLENGELVEMLEKEEKSESMEYEKHLEPEVLRTGIERGEYIQGTLSVSRYNVWEGNVSVGGSRGKNVLVVGKRNLNRGIHGDLVGVKILPRSQWMGPIEELVDEEIGIEACTEEKHNKVDETRMNGKIVGIIVRNTRSYCGSIDRKTINEELAFGFVQRVLFTPIDSRVPKIRVDTRQALFLINKRIVVRLDEWENDRPRGHFVKNLGDMGDKDVETACILHEHGIEDEPFSPAVQECLPVNPWMPLVGEREDLRHLHVFSIDPPECMDIDDAFHMIQLGNGNYQVGVHIADVGHFVKPGTPLDKEAMKRGSTTYLVDRRIDMIPTLLGTDICSLKLGVDRYAFSCVWEIDEHGRVLDTRYVKSIVRSRASLTYQQAREEMDGRGPLCEMIRGLWRIAEKLRNMRIENGALVLGSGEIRFSMESMDVETRRTGETNWLVEEFMILANISVAETIYRRFPDFSLLRRHPPPPPENFEYLIRAMSTRGIELNVQTQKDLGRSLEQAIDPDDEHFSQVVRLMVTRCMSQAVYFSSGTRDCKEFEHYGLGISMYTHFTSPIRRYADIVVHRLLEMAISQDPGPFPVECCREEIEIVCQHLNERNRMVHEASRKSTELFVFLCFRNKTLEEEARVIRIFRNGIVFVLPRLETEGRIHLDSNSTLVYDPEAMSLIDPTTSGLGVRVFDKIRVRVSGQGQGLEYVWIDGCSAPESVF